jgi:hypothetical protein
MMVWIKVGMAVGFHQAPATRMDLETNPWEGGARDGKRKRGSEVYIF